MARKSAPSDQQFKAVLQEAEAGGELVLADGDFDDDALGFLAELRRQR